ncbi:MAG: hypothetical protein ACP5G0_11840 [Desulfomonilia bacterium]
MRILEPVTGTDSSLDRALITAHAMEIQNRIDAARIRFILDAQKNAASLVSELVEHLGRTIDLYV